MSDLAGHPGDLRALDADLTVCGGSGTCRMTRVGSGAGTANPAGVSPEVSPGHQLFHFTCAHAKPLIVKAGALIPQIAWRRLDALLCEQGEVMTGLWRAPAVVWLTDMAEPERETLGLTSYTLRCDRTEFRCTVDASRGEPWLDFAARWNANPAYLARLTGDPRRWFVATDAVPVLEILDRRGAPARDG